MNLKLNKQELARGLELNLLTNKLKENAKNNINELVLTKEPFGREKKNIKNLVVAFGSYDPLTKAHEQLFLEGLNMMNKKEENELLVVISTSHFNKKIDYSVNSSISDRLHSIEAFASANENVAIGAYNNAYFINLLEDVRKQYNEDTQINLVIGSDVLEKIINPRYYENLDVTEYEVIKRLFQYNFLISERKITIEDEEKNYGFNELAEKFPVLYDYQDKFQNLKLNKKDNQLEIHMGEVSSTKVRNKRKLEESIDNLVAFGISDFVDKRGIYLADNNFYHASVCLREMYLKENFQKPISDYVEEYIANVNQLENDGELQNQVIKKYNEVLK